MLRNYIFFALAFCLIAFMELAMAQDCLPAKASFDDTFTAYRLRNWEVPKFYPTQQSKKRSPKVIANERGHLLPNVQRPKSSPWGNFKGTWQLPDKISRERANEINQSKQLEEQRWATRVRRHKKDEATTNGNDTEKPINLEYTPGDFTESKQQHPSRELLLRQKYDRDRAKAQELELTENNLEKHDSADQIALLDEERRRERATQNLSEVAENNNSENMGVDQQQIPEKPNLRSPSPIIPAVFNFQMARKMAAENLEHQPLPDCIIDQAFRKLQVQGDPNPGLALEVPLNASGVGVKTYKAGPTHCTKMKVYRPKTCGVLPKPVKGTYLHRVQTPVDGKKMGLMDLAICWDYRPADPNDEPKRTKHIDGSNGCAAPAVFTLVKTPRSPEKIETGRSAGVFTSTLGEPGFFDKDIMRKKTGLVQRSKSDLKCTCGTSPINFPIREEFNHNRSKSASRDGSAIIENRKRYKSSPNLSRFAVSEGDAFKENNFQYLEPEKYRPKKEHTCSKYGPKGKVMEKPKIRRPARLCQKVAPQPYPEIKGKEIFKTAFKAGIPKSNSSGTVTSFDSGCSTMSSNCSTKVLVIPKPRNPYAKKNYNIDTLVPPFTCYKGGAGQGGYPEHWRLASVYQHAYKPIEQRKRPLLETVYK